eukprot:Rhum_TRINITY_DN14194_c6_g1::Rhum_TRINITY_DN14194_c6_g1_i1::g.71838::m.71838
MLLLLLRRLLLLRQLQRGTPSRGNLRLRRGGAAEDPKLRASHDGRGGREAAGTSRTARPSCAVGGVVVVLAAEPVLRPQLHPQPLVVLRQPPQVPQQLGLPLRDAVVGRPTPHALPCARRRRALEDAPRRFTRHNHRRATYRRARLVHSRPHVRRRHGRRHRRQRQRLVLRVVLLLLLRLLVAVVKRGAVLRQGNGAGGRRLRHALRVVPAGLAEVVAVLPVHFLGGQADGARGVRVVHARLVHGVPEGAVRLALRRRRRRREVAACGGDAAGVRRASAARLVRVHADGGREGGPADERLAAGVGEVRRQHRHDFTLAEIDEVSAVLTLAEGTSDAAVEVCVGDHALDLHDVARVRFVHLLGVYFALFVCFCRPAGL